MATTYPSRVDTWIALALAIAPLSGIAVIVSGVAAGDDATLFIGIGVTAFCALLYLGLIVPMRYTVAADELEIRFGFARIRIPWQRLQRGALSSNPLSSPALSLRRIRLDYAKENGKETFVMISPPEREDFLRAIADASPHHSLADGELVRD